MKKSSTHIANSSEPAGKNDRVHNTATKKLKRVDEDDEDEIEKEDDYDKVDKEDNYIEPNGPSKKDLKNTSLFIDDDDDDDED